MSEKPKTGAEVLEEWEAIVSAADAMKRPRASVLEALIDAALREREAMALEEAADAYETEAGKPRNGLLASAARTAVLAVVENLRARAKAKREGA